MVNIRGIKDRGAESFSLAETDFGITSRIDAEHSVILAGTSIPKDEAVRSLQSLPSRQRIEEYLIAIEAAQSFDGAETHGATISRVLEIALELGDVEKLFEASFDQSHEEHLVSRKGHALLKALSFAAYRGDQEVVLQFCSHLLENGDLAKLTASPRIPIDLDMESPWERKEYPLVKIAHSVEAPGSVILAAMQGRRFELASKLIELFRSDSESLRQLYSEEFISSCIYSAVQFDQADLLAETLQLVRDGGIIQSDDSNDMESYFWEDTLTTIEELRRRGGERGVILSYVSEETRKFNGLMTPEIRNRFQRIVSERLDQRDQENEAYSQLKGLLMSQGDRLLEQEEVQKFERNLDIGGQLIPGSFEQLAHLLHSYAGTSKAIESTSKGLQLLFASQEQAIEWANDYLNWAKTSNPLLTHGRQIMDAYPSFPARVSENEVEAFRLVLPVAIETQLSDRAQLNARRILAERPDAMMLLSPYAHLLDELEDAEDIVADFSEKIVNELSKKHNLTDVQGTLLETLRSRRDQDTADDWTQVSPGEVAIHLFLPASLEFREAIRTLSALGALGNLFIKAPGYLSGHHEYTQSPDEDSAYTIALTSKSGFPMQELSFVRSVLADKGLDIPMIGFHVGNDYSSVEHYRPFFTRCVPFLKESNSETARNFAAVLEKGGTLEEALTEIPTDSFAFPIFFDEEMNLIIDSRSLLDVLLDETHPFEEESSD